MYGIIMDTLSDALIRVDLELEVLERLRVKGVFRQVLIGLVFLKGEEIYESSVKYLCSNIYFLCSL